MNAQQLFELSAQQKAAQQAQQQNAPQPQGGNAQGGWTCSCGATGNNGNFCMNCGKPKPAPAGWNCAKCGATGNTGNFCMNCGAPKSAPKPVYRCNKCGWQPDDPHNPPRFCPQCGDAFDENDVQ